MAESFLKDPLNDPLRLGEKSFEPSAQKVDQNDFASSQTQLSSGRQQLSRAYDEERRLIKKQEDLEGRIARDTANLVSYRQTQELFKAQQQAEAAKKDSENIKKMLDEVRSSPLYKQKEETNKQIAEYSAFVPTEVTAPMLGVLFATIGAAGMLLGGNNKNTAKSALAAMNGMAEGFAKGREQYDKERKQSFDTNVKLLQTKLSAINDGLEDARREAVYNKQAADLKVRETLASNDAQFLQENTNRRGLESTIELVKGQLKSLDRALGFQATKTRQIEGELRRNEMSLESKKVAADHAQAIKKISEQARADEAARRREFELEQLIRRQSELGQPVAIQGNNAIYVDKNGKVVSVPLPQGSVPVARNQPRPEPRPRVEVPRVGMQDGGLVQYSPSALPTANVAAPITSPSAAPKKEGGSVKPPPKEILTRVEARDSLIPALKELLPVLDRLNKEGQYNKLSIALNSPTTAEWVFRNDLEAIKAIRILAKFRAGEFETAGKALTAKEDEILRPLYQAANRPYVSVKNAVEEGLRELTQQNEGYKNAYPEFYGRRAASGDALAQRMDQAGATSGQSGADERSQAQAAILKIQNSQLTPEQKQERIKNIESSYKQRNGLNL